MKLIVENPFIDYQSFETLIEQKNPQSPKKIYVKGPYIVAEKKNANGRTYSKTLMEKVVDKYREDHIKKNKAFGELNHPDSSEINPKNICHMCVELKQDNNVWIGKSVVLASSQDGSIKGTPQGDILASILQYSGKMGMSTRGVGTINENNIIDKEYVLIAEDAVIDPSGPGCFVSGILESKNFIINTHGEIIEQAYEKLEKGLVKLPKNNKKIYINTLLENFLNNI